MPDYRLYLLNKSGHFDASEGLEAENDGDATAMAEVVYDAVSEVFQGYELWFGGRLVASGRQVGVSKSPSDLTPPMKASLLEVMERLRDSRFALRQSPRLLEQIGKLGGRQH